MSPHFAPDFALVCEGPEATAALGARLAGVLGVGDAVFLDGPLGAGKTTLARGLVQVWAGEEEAPSPTYTLAQSYPGPKGVLWHLDLYRVRDPDEVEELGLADMLGEGCAVIEWPERLGAWRAARWLENRLEVSIVPTAAGAARDITVRGYGRLRGALIA